MEARFCLGGLSDPFLMQDLNTEGEFAPTCVGGERGGGSSIITLHLLCQLLVYFHFCLFVSSSLTS